MSEKAPRPRKRRPPGARQSDAGARLTDPEQAVARFITEENLLPAGARVTVAVSGGGDSVALLHILLALARAGAGCQLSVAHLNHQLRPGSAEADEAFVRGLAGQLDLPYCCEARDVRAEARERRLNLEAAARAVRYEFLEEVATKQGSEYVATGHTRDDQLETILWRISRASPRSRLSDLAVPASLVPEDGNFHRLMGMPSSRPIREGSAVTLVRPLLTVSREALRTYLNARHIPWRTDETNLDLSRTRSRVRHHVLPHLREKLREAYFESLLRLSGHAAQLNRQTAELVEDALAEHLREEESELALPLACLRGLPPDIAGLLLYRTLRKAELAGAPPGRFLDSALTGRHVQAVLEAVSLDRPRFLAHLPRGLLVECTGEELRIRWGLPEPTLQRGGTGTPRCPGGVGENFPHAVGVTGREAAARGAEPHGEAVRPTGTRRLSARAPVPPPAAASAVAPRPLPAGDGTVTVPELGFQVVVRERARSEVDWEDWLRRKGPLEELVDADCLSPKSAPLPSPPPLGEGQGEGGPASEALLLRTRAPGDRFRPLNGPGGRRLKEFLIDRKVPRRERDRTLLLARGKAVLWVAGLGPSDDVKVRGESQRLLHLQVEPLTG